MDEVIERAMLFEFRYDGGLCPHGLPLFHASRSGRPWHSNATIETFAPDDHSVLAPRAMLMLDVRLKLTPTTYLMDPCR